MFTPDDRDRLRQHLLDHARRDPRLSGAAITGSASEGREDAWSDIDLAFGVASQADIPTVMADWTDRMYRDQGALHHYDVAFGAWRYRVFLLGSTLQVDLAFAPASEFRALEPTFRLVFGEAAEPRTAPAQNPDAAIGMAWLYALHARSCIARGKPWRAEFMISGVRDQALALACLRHGLVTAYGRGIDLLPNAEAAPFEAALVRSLDPPELTRAFRSAVDLLKQEIRLAAPELADLLQPALSELPR